MFNRKALIKKKDVRTLFNKSFPIKHDDEYLKTGEFLEAVYEDVKKKGLHEATAILKNEYGLTDKQLARYRFESKKRQMDKRRVQKKLDDKSI